MPVPSDPHQDAPHRLSVVIPVYRGAATLPGVVDELLPLTEEFSTPEGHLAVLDEIVLVHDRGPDESDVVVRELREKHAVVRTVWLSRNFGQHPATLAGISATGGDWILTMDEDGQHDPAYIPAMLDTAMRDRAAVVYAAPTNSAPHGWFRNASSWGAKKVLDLLAPGSNAGLFHSYRLMVGEVGRTVSAYAASGVYLDIALSWLAADVTTCPVELRDERDRPSGYRTRTLLSHFWRMVLTSGTRLLRIVSILGVVVAVAGVALAGVAATRRLVGEVHVEGWTSVLIAILLCGGAILFALGVVAEYLGVAVNMALGKPPYVILSDPADGPLGRPPANAPVEHGVPSAGTEP